jgi:hypothetical protein
MSGIQAVQAEPAQGKSMPGVGERRASRQAALLARGRVGDLASMTCTPIARGAAPQARPAPQARRARGRARASSQQQGLRFIASKVDKSSRRLFAHLDAVDAGMARPLAAPREQRGDRGRLASKTASTRPSAIARETGDTDGAGLAARRGA